MAIFSGLPMKAVADMKQIFSVATVPIKPSRKKKEMKVKYRILNDIVDKALMAEAGSFDAVTTNRFELMVAINSGLKINWEHVLFNVLASMVSNLSMQSQGYRIQISLIWEKLVKADLGESTSLHPLKVLNTKSVHT
ncbi:hypothetical protein F511_41836 [Dorcoceras hygrometricum]|uniref:Uncharacterized protein n=1 Tax=Dorcoceras hygrometricum TaxID=472368 RepID=A0A2Z7AJK2_9LAMI|nr:hypothetical protein F511_41836 [Dorcoceras hygrometricum]